MPRDNRELIEEGVRAFNERDLDALLASVHADAEIELFGGFSEVMGKHFSGRDAIGRFYADWFATFATMHVE